MNEIKEIKEDLKIFNATTEEKVVWLLSEVERHNEAWNVMTSLPMGMHPSEIREFAKKMLKGEKPYLLGEV